MLTPRRHRASAFPATMSASTTDRRVPRRPTPSERALDEQRVERAVALAFAPMHKAAFGVALGVVLALGMLLLTLGGLMLDPGGTVPLELLRQYFAGYERSVLGAFVGAAWGFFIGFIAGWFLAFMRNFVLATWLLIVRARAEWAASRDFLDHI